MDHQLDAREEKTFPGAFSSSLVLAHPAELGYRHLPLDHQAEIGLSFASRFFLSFQEIETSLELIVSQVPHCFVRIS
jgi:hypothetical protein